MNAKSAKTHKALREKKRGWLEPTVFALAGLAILIGLGIWQLDRKVWKENLIATLNQRLAVAPVTGLPSPAEWKKLDPAQNEYKRVFVPVEFLNEQEALVYTPGSAFRPDIKSIGYWVMTPARLPGGSVVVVNRGFVPLEKKNPAARAEGQVTGPVDITAVMRWPEPRGLFTPSDEPKNNIWYTRDPAVIAANKNWGDVAPFFLEMEQPAPPGGLPSPGKLEVHLRDNHLGYALTWFGLALTLAGVYVTFMVSRWRER